jgi:hypothetical protein
VHEESQCDKHHRDLYFGDEHRPGLTTRVLVMENTVNSFKFYARWLLLLVGGIFATAVAGLVIKK